MDYPLVTINNEDEFFLYVKKIQPTEVVIDNYAFTCRDEKEFKKLFPDIKLSVFDDDYREHFCDEIINHNLSADITKYSNQNIVKIIKPLIRDEFVKEKQIKREKIYDIFIAMGGTDSTNINIPILKSLPNYLQVSLVTTSANKNLKELKEFIKYKDNVTLQIDSNKVAKLLNQSKFAIVTPSVIVHEVLYMEVPFAAIKTESNQDDIYIWLKKNKYKTFKDIWAYLKSQRINDSVRF